MNGPNKRANKLLKYNACPMCPIGLQGKSFIRFEAACRCTAIQPIAGGRISLTYSLFYGLIGLIGPANKKLGFLRHWAVQSPVQRSRDVQSIETRKASTSGSRVRPLADWPYVVRLSQVATKKVAIVPERLTASSACRPCGFTRMGPTLCASLSLFRSVPSDSTTDWQLPRMRLNTSSVCASGARRNSAAISR